MDEFICNKLRSGKLKYGIDYVNRKLCILEDIPGYGDKCGECSKELIDFETINNILVKKGNILSKNSMDLQPCFIKPISNNGPMLAAILVHLGVLDKNYKVLKLL